MVEQIYTLEQLAEQFHVQKSSVMRWLRQGHLPAERLEHGYKITEKDFEFFFTTPDGQALAATQHRLAEASAARKALGKLP